ncbi:hypothetical protein [Myceligenerans pegani]|uniref:Extracellular solute-binding protein n=1 Tax=Myceligenerans pegani TaxID=2776917 RepID=A0ABR9MSV2_9MICO|nr:hypothetical protein [Myceligenerans sp. TRM 65318]MBE1874457.1 hypothetical protein [Myceligenerans sp. TRM 65318]MBE3016728.1 hypothetical protein [Myceligenerans sp. TRM 65318]
MDRKILRIRISVAASVSALVLSAAAWGPGLDGPGRDAEDGLRVLIGAGSGGETRSVRAAVRAWSADSGREASVAVAADMPRQLSRGFANGNPPDVFALGTEEFAAYATRGFLRPYGDDFAGAGHLHPALVEAFTVDGALVCAPKDPDAAYDAGASPAGAPTGTASSLECWGIAADSPDHRAAVDLVRHLTRSASESADG